MSLAISGYRARVGEKRKLLNVGRALANSFVPPFSWMLLIWTQSLPKRRHELCPPRAC